MRTIIAGSRDVTDYEKVTVAVKLSGFVITEVVSGGARGVDTLGEQYAKEHSLSCKRFPADWSKYGRAAGPIRNEQMAEYAEALVALPVKTSKGTRHMIKAATARGLRVFVKEVTNDKTNSTTTDSSDAT